MGIYVNQTGYFPDAEKLAVSTFPCNFQLICADTQHSIFDGTTSPAKADASAGEDVYTIDFSSVRTPGRYYILAGNGEKSHSFQIEEHVYEDLKRSLMKALYYQRCGCALTGEHAGVYTHEACHTAPAIFLEDYLAGTLEPERFDMTGGWHDAGDFGRYTSAGAAALGHLLYAYELFPHNLQTNLNIPESGNALPDLLNECLYELKWMLKMQSPSGGCYHKLTSFNHADFIMPEEDHAQFIIYPVSSMATADFAAVMALASRIYKDFLPDFAGEALAASKRAWDWLEKNPYTGFHNPEGSNTGEYDDDCDLDERLWASAELLRTDKANASDYLKRLQEYSKAPLSKTDFGWTDVSGFAALTILFDPSRSAGELTEEYRKILFQEADRLCGLQETSGYHLAMAPEDFVWGSNMVVCNRSMLLILASLLSEGEASMRYRTAALNQLHYLLGRNALDISYVTGFGENAFKNPHNRPTFADGIDLPMPGWVSGGPFKTPCDPAAEAAIAPGSAPMKCYVDDVGSYSTNEITIYWNSPAVFITAFLNH
ncbi:MAG: glycoside hydrolase family 9 protein [Lachnospiraceae bacterium]|nr:glycoside hydrolase family 9 protein [Lachnospiraceae bacterium]